MVIHHIGSAIEPVGEDKFIIAHVTNNLGAWGAGFVVPLGRAWPEARAAYMKDYSEGVLEYGHVSFVQITDLDRQGWIANMTAQTLGVENPLNMEALKECVGKVIAFAKEKGASIHSPRFGAGLAGGNWKDIEALIADADWHVYTLPNQVENFPYADYTK